MSNTLVCADPAETTHVHCANHGCVQYVCCQPAGVSLTKRPRVLPVGTVVEYCVDNAYMFPLGMRGVVVGNADYNNSFYAYDVVFPNDPHMVRPAALAMGANEVQVYK